MRRKLSKGKTLAQLRLSSPVAGTMLCTEKPIVAELNLSRILSRGEVRPPYQAAAAAGAALRAASAALAAAAEALDPAGAPALSLLPAAPAPAVLRAGSGVASSRPADYTPVLELINQFLTAKARQGRSDRYLRAMRVSLSSFCRGRSRVDASAVTMQEIEAWLAANQWAPRTQKGYLNDVRTMYAWGARRGLCAGNPARAVETPEVPPALPALHTPGQVAAALEFARAWDLNLCRALAIRYFAGLRSAEASRLEESEIGPVYIEVAAAKSKTRRRRLVAIEPNLAAWLALGGALPLHDVNNRFRLFTAALAKARAVGWPYNVTRHSFCSYHLARWQSASKTALAAGHTEQMLFANYRELVTPEAAAEFWAIRPK